MPSLFAKSFRGKLHDLMEYNYVQQRLKEAEEVQGIGHLTRIFDDFKFNKKCARQAYKQCSEASDVLEHVMTVAREAVKPMFNEDMSDLSDRMKASLGDEHYNKLLELCPDKNPQKLVDTFIQATVVIYGQVLGLGLSQLKKTIEENPKLNSKEKRTQQDDLTIAYNERISSPMEQFCPLVNSKRLNGEVPPTISLAELEEFYQELQADQQALIAYKDELLSKLGYPIKPLPDDKSPLEPDTLYLSIVDSQPPGKKQYAYTILTKDSATPITDNLDIEAQQHLTTKDLTEDKLKDKKLDLINELANKKIINPELRALNHLQAAIKTIGAQLDKIETSKTKIETHELLEGSKPTGVKPIHSIAHEIAYNELQSVCSQIEKTVNNDLLNVPHAPHIKSLGERFLNAIVQFFTKGKVEYKSEETKKAESRAALSTDLDTLAKSVTMKERLQQMKDSDPQEKQANEEEHEYEHVARLWN